MKPGQTCRTNGLLGDHRIDSDRRTGSDRRIDSDRQLIGQLNQQV